MVSCLRFFSLCVSACQISLTNSSLFPMYFFFFSAFLSVFLIVFISVFLSCLFVMLLRVCHCVRWISLTNGFVPTIPDPNFLRKLKRKTIAITFLNIRSIFEHQIKYYSNIHVVCDHSEGQFFVQRIFPTPLGALLLTICSLDASWAFRKRQIWKTIAPCSALKTIPNLQLSLVCMGIEACLCQNGGFFSSLK